jgi:hypothetical protein
VRWRTNGKSLLWQTRVVPEYFLLEEAFSYSAISMHKQVFDANNAEFSMRFSEYRNASAA